MTDFKFYKDEYNGSVIPSEAEFNKVLNRATAYIDALILHREYLEYEQAQKAYNMAVCAVCDNEYTYTTAEATSGSRGAIASESVGNHSISYAVSTEADKIALLRNKNLIDAKMYLAHTGLLYGGMAQCSCTQ